MDDANANPNEMLAVHRLGKWRSRLRNALLLSTVGPGVVVAVWASVLVGVLMIVGGIFLSRALVEAGSHRRARELARELDVPEERLGELVEQLARL